MQKIVNGLLVFILVIGMAGCLSDDGGDDNGDTGGDTNPTIEWSVDSSADYILRADGVEEGNLEFDYWGDLWDTASTIEEITNESYSKVVKVTNGAGWGDANGLAYAWGREGGNELDISSYSTFNFQVKTDDFTTLQVDFQSATQTEVNKVVDLTAGTEIENGWVDVSVTTPDFADMTWVGISNKDSAKAGSIMLTDIRFK